MLCRGHVWCLVFSWVLNYPLKSQLFVLICHHLVGFLNLNELGVSRLLFFPLASYLLSQPIQFFFLCLAHFVQCESFSAEPVPFIFKFASSCLLFGSMPLCACFFLEVNHVFLNNSHLLFKCWEKVFFVFFNYFCDVVASVLTELLEGLIIDSLIFRSGFDRGSWRSGP